MEESVVVKYLKRKAERRFKTEDELVGLCLMQEIISIAHFYNHKGKILKNEKNRKIYIN